MEIRCVKGMYRLKLVSCENNSGFKGLKIKKFGLINFCGLICKIFLAVDGYIIEKSILIV